MGLIRIKDRSFKTDLLLDFTKGFAFPGKSDNEGELFQNFELGRDGTLQSRLGCFRHNTNDFGGQPILGFGRQFFGVAGTDTIVAAQGSGSMNYQWTIAPYFVASAWQQFSSNYDAQFDPVVFETCTLLDETPILVSTNVNFGSLEYWDGTAGTAVEISGSPAGATLLRLSASRLYASGVPLFGTRVYYSDQSDPTSWPSENFFDVLPNRGNIMALEVAAGTGTTLNIATDRSWQAMYGDPAPGGGLSVQTVQDGIGTDNPRGVNTFGSLTLSPWRGDLYLFSGSIQNVSEPYRGITMAGEFNQTWQSGSVSSINLGVLQGVSVDSVNEEVFVSSSNNAIYVFDRLAPPGTLPKRTIQGASTILDNPEALFVDTVGDLVLVPNLGGTTPAVSFPLTGNGDISPSGSLTNAYIGGSSQIWLDYVNQEILVAGNNNNQYSIFRNGTGGSTPPLRTVSGGSTGFNFVYGGISDSVNDEIVIVCGPPNTVSVFPRLANGNVAPSRVIVGGDTGLDNPAGVNVDTTRDEYSVVNANSGSITFYPRTANGNVAPTRTISGTATLLNGPLATAIDLVNNEIYVANSNGLVTVYNITDSDDAAPKRVFGQTQVVTPSGALQAYQKQSSGTITPYHIWYRPCMNTNADASDGPTNDLPTLLYCIDRERTGWFSIFAYPTNSGIGASNPWQAVVYGVDTNVMLAGGDGNIYLQPMRVLSQQNILGQQSVGQPQPPPNFTNYTPDTGVSDSGTTVDVTSTWRSRFREQGNPSAVKQARDIMFAGACTTGSAQVTLNVMDVSGGMSQYSAKANQSMPFGFTVPLTGLANYFRLQAELTATNFYLVSCTVSFRQKMITGQFYLK